MTDSDKQFSQDLQFALLMCQGINEERLKAFLRSSQGEINRMERLFKLWEDEKQKWQSPPERKVEVKIDYSNEDKPVSEKYKTLARIRMANLNPLVPTALLEKVLESHNFHIYPSASEYPKSFQHYPGIYIFNNIVYDAEIKPRQQRIINVNEDKEFADENKALNIQLNELKSQKDDRMQKALEFVIAEEKGEKTYECPICYDPFLQKDLVSCTANKEHVICHQDLRSSIITKLNVLELQLGCQYEDCEGRYNNEVCRAVLSESEYERVGEIQANNELLASGVQNLERCPFCSFAQVMGPERAKELEFRCEHPRCRMVSCRRCRKVSHLPTKCKEMLDEGLFSLRSFVQQKMDDAFFVICPNCHKPVVKITGCNRVPCNCGRSFCYVCGALCPQPDPYVHFRAAGAVCALWWKGNELQDRVQKAKRDAEAEWKNIHPQHRDIVLDI